MPNLRLRTIAQDTEVLMANSAGLTIKGEFTATCKKNVKHDGATQ